MTDLDREDTYTQSATGERKRRQKKTLPKPLLRLLLVLAGIVIVVVIIVLASRAAIHSGEAADYQRYMTSVADILKRSDDVGSQLEKLLTDPGDVNRTQIQTTLDKLAATSETLEVEAKALDAPTDLVDQGIHQFFLLVMSFRKIGVTDLKPSLMSALEVEDTEVSAEQISHALQYLANSDFLYEEVFIPRAADLLTQKELAEVTIPDTKFLSDPDLASKSQVKDMLSGLKSTGNLQEVHGVALVKVVAMPDNKEITAGGTFNLTSTTDLRFEVTVENQGNMEEKEVPVTVTLPSDDPNDPQKVTVKIPSLKSKEVVTVEVKGLNPTEYGEVALLKVSAGPVQGEKYKDNNTIQAKVIFKL